MSESKPRGASACGNSKESASTARLVKSRLAIQDLEYIWNFIAQSDVERADEFLDSILEKCELLAQFPKIGRARHELLINLRSFPVKNYIVFYQPINDGIEILRIVHGSRDVEQMFDDFFENLEREN